MRLRNLNSYNYGHAFSAAVTILIATMVAMNYSFSNEGWIMIAAFISGQTTRGTPFKQSLYFTAIIFAAVILSTPLMQVFSVGILMQVLACCIFIGAGLIVFYRRPLQETTYFYIILLPLILMFALFIPTHDQLNLYDRLIDILIGAAIGIACAQIIFPVRPYKDFAHTLSPILNALAAYTSAVSKYLLTDNNSLQHERVLMELALQSSGKLYPEWVFETGYNPGLRSGYRYFLINLERISELLFSLDYLLGTGIKANLSNEMRICFADVVQLNSELIQTLAKKLNGETVEYSSANYIEDIDRLENEMQSQLPVGLELLSFTQENIQIVNVARDLKDMRTLLMQLLLSLPETTLTP
jgi:hypothetical protein